MLQGQDFRLVVTSIRISPWEREKLECLATQEERTVSQVARRLLRAQLSRAYSKPSSRNQRHAARCKTDE